MEFLYSANRDLSNYLLSVYLNSILIFLTFKK